MAQQDRKKGNQKILIWAADQGIKTPRLMALNKAF